MSWNGVITDVGINKFNTAGSGGPLVVIDGFIIGSSSNYIPTTSQTSLHGTILRTGTAEELRYLIASQDTVVYRILLDSSVSSMTFGEVGLLSGSDLVYIATSTININKLSGSIFQLDLGLKLSNASNLLDMTVNVQDIGILPSVSNQTLLPSNATMVPYNTYRVISNTTTSSNRPALAIAGSGTSFNTVTTNTTGFISPQIRNVTSTTLPTTPDNFDMVRVTNMDNAILVYDSSISKWIQLD